MILQGQADLAYIPALLAVLGDIYQNDRGQGQLLITALRSLLARISGHTDTHSPELAEICCQLADALDQAEATAKPIQDGGRDGN